MISLCDRCIHYDTETMRKLRESADRCGHDRPTHIWCDIDDRPEDERWEKCMNFEDAQ